MENSFIKKRAAFLQWLVNHTAPLYMKLTKGNKAKWKYETADLKKFPADSLGRELYDFLKQRNLDMIPKAERHDVFHILTGYDITPEEEAVMQFWLLGNRKWTPYTLGTCIIGMVLIPEHWSDFKTAFKKGWIDPSIHDWDFENMLHLNYNRMLASIHQPIPQPFF